MSEAIAYAGEPGAFAEDALLSYFGAAAPSLSVSSFGDVRAAVLDGRAVYGVLPIENLINGTVRETLDLLRDGALEIVGEVVVPVSLVLAALPGVILEQVDRVYSHAQALAQAEEYLRSRPWALLTTYNTAGAGAMIRERGERDAAAVLSPRAAASNRRGAGKPHAFLDRATSGWLNGASHHEPCAYNLAGRST
jgi:prephenate dehydratase